LVTHAAGCNALMGALTNQPVLIDFGLASLSMAVRKESSPRHTSPVNGHSVSPVGRRRSSVDFGLAEEYEVQIMASASHLRAGAEAAKAAALQSPHLVAHIPEYRRHNNVKVSGGAMSAALNGAFDPNDLRRSTNSALGSMRRSSLTPASSYRNSSPSPSRSTTSASSGGLWSKASTTAASLDGMQDLYIGSPAHTRPGSSSSDKPPSTQIQAVLEQPKEGSKDYDAPTPPTTPRRTMSQAVGLWGKKDAESPRGREPVAPKRRWTLSEQDNDV